MNGRRGLDGGSILTPRIRYTLQEIIQHFQTVDLGASKGKPYLTLVGSSAPSIKHMTAGRKSSGAAHGSSQVPENSGRLCASIGLVPTKRLIYRSSRRSPRETSELSLQAARSLGHVLTLLQATERKAYRAIELIRFESGCAGRLPYLYLRRSTSDMGTERLETCYFSRAGTWIKIASTRFGFTTTDHTAAFWGKPSALEAIRIARGLQT